MSEEEETKEEMKTWVKEGYYYTEVLVECAKCGHAFEMDKPLFIKASSIPCPKCGESMTKEKGIFNEAILVKCPKHNASLKHMKPETIIRRGEIPGHHIWDCPIKECCSRLCYCSRKT